MISMAYDLAFQGISFALRNTTMKFNWGCGPNCLEVTDMVSGNTIVRIVTALMFAITAVSYTACDQDRNKVKLSKSEKSKLDKQAKRGKEADATLKKAEEAQAAADKANADAQAALQAVEAIKSENEATAKKNADDKSANESEKQKIEEYRASVELNIEEQRKTHTEALQAIETAKVRATGELNDLQGEITSAKDALSLAQQDVAAAKAKVEKIVADANAEAQGIRESAKSDADTIVGQSNEIKAQADQVLEAALLKEATAQQKLEKLTAQLKDVEDKLAHLALEQKKADEREQRISDLEQVWQGLFEQYKLTDVFDSIVNKDGVLTFQVSVVGSANIDEVKQIRSIMKALKNSDKVNLSELYPSAQAIKDSEAAIADAQAILKRPDINVIRKKINESVVQNNIEIGNVRDIYLVKVKAIDLKNARDQIIALVKSSETAKIFVIPRLVNEVQVSVKLQIAARQDAKADSKQVVDISVNLGAKSTTLISEVDLEKPGSYIFPDKDVCSKVSPACFEALKQAGLLDIEYTKTIQDEKFDNVDITAKASDIIGKYLQRSNTQLKRDILLMQNPESLVGWTRKMSEDGTTSTKFEIADDIVEKVLGIEDRYPIAEKFNISYEVSMLVDIPDSGLVPVDTLMSDRNFVKGKSFKLKKRNYNQYEITLPINVEASARDFTKEFSVKGKKVDAAATQRMDQYAETRALIKALAN